MKASMMIAVFALTAESLVLGQQILPPSKPGPEHAKLAALMGNWTTAGQSTENPFGPAETWSGKISSEWFPGRFAIVRHVEGKGSVAGDVRSLDVITYDAPAKAYTWYGIDNLGTTALGKGQVTGDTLTVVWETAVKGKPYKIRGTLKGLGADRLTWVSEYSENGKVWKAYFRSTDTKSKP
jgi:hypothetical protein